jgi:hypothetical protein
MLAVRLTLQSGIEDHLEPNQIPINPATRKAVKTSADWARVRSVIAGFLEWKGLVRARKNSPTRIKRQSTVINGPESEKTDTSKASPAASAKIKKICQLSRLMANATFEGWTLDAIGESFILMPPMRKRSLGAPRC